MWKYWLMALVSPLLWGTTYAVSQRWLADVHPMWQAAGRVMLCGLVMLPLLRFSTWRTRWRDILLLALFNIAIFTLLLFVSIVRLPGGVSATLVSTVPLVVLLLLWVQGQAPGFTRLLASLAGVVGVGMLVLKGEAHLDWIGVAAALGACFSMAIGALLVPKLSKGIPPLELAAYQIVVAGILLTGAALMTGAKFPTLGTEQWLSLIWIGPIGVGIGYFCWFKGLTVLPVDKLAFLGLINPVIAVALGVVVMDETFTGVQVAGMVVVLTSLLVAQLPSGTLRPSAGVCAKAEQG